MFFKNCTTLDILFVSILAGLGEEALFRGVFQSFLAQWTHPLVSLIVVSIVFGMAHFVSLMYAIFAGLIGVYLGALYLYFDGLAVPMTVHAVYDFLALIYGVRFRRFAAVEAP